MGLDSYLCWNETVTDEVPPEHKWLCCGFNELPMSVSGTWALEDPGDHPECVEQFGTNGTFTFSRAICGVVYSSPALPFYVGITGNPLCIGSPNGPNNHITSWGMGPGSPVYDAGNACVRDPNTGAITFNLCASHVGTPCKFRVCVTAVG